MLQVHCFLTEKLIQAIKKHIDLMLAESSHFQYGCRNLEQKITKRYHTTETLLQGAFNTDFCQKYF